MRLMCMMPPRRALTSRRLSMAPLLLTAAATCALGAAPVSGAAPASDAARTASAPAPAASVETHLNHGRFRDFLVYRPAGPPTSFVLFLSGEEGWTATAATMARHLVRQGAMVAGIDAAKFKATLEADADQCEFADGDLENLSHFVQA